MSITLASDPNDDPPMLPEGSVPAAAAGPRGRPTSSSSSSSSQPSSSRRRTVTWLRLYGGLGVVVVSIHCLTLLILAVLFYLHCTSDALKRLSGEEAFVADVRGIFGITPAGAVVLGVAFVLAALLSVLSLVTSTCRWRTVVLRERDKMFQKQHATGRVVSYKTAFCVARFMSFLRDWLTKPGSPYYVWWRFRAKLWDLCLQTYALHLYGEAGIPRPFLVVFAANTLLGGISTVLLSIRDDTAGPNGPSTRSLGFLVVIDCILDMHVCLFPLYVAVVQYHYLTPRFLDRESAQLAAIEVIKFGLYGTSDECGTILKLISRLFPLGV
eukprot:g3627.t1